VPIITSLHTTLHPFPNIIYIKEAKYNPHIINRQKTSPILFYNRSYILVTYKNRSYIKGRGGGIGDLRDVKSFTSSSRRIKYAN
jgi:hypothetical protein